ncbi:glycosyltransferase family 4 protein [Actinotalea caeni]|uniref:glycosyltransferase family 4 protein n=1 Tax=Actinotalea caeni TaxID=1348467 RepID=UPI0012E1CEE4|nr:glycosyltransferase family 4 protein [Actinotalea caeni]
MADVALVASSFAPRVGGVEEHVRNAAARLREQGVDVVVWTVDQGDAVPAEVDGVPVRVLPCPLPARTPRSLLSFVWRGPWAALRWAGALRRDRPRVLHVQCFGPNGVWALAASLLTRRRLLVTSHGETFGDADDAFGGSALLRRGLRAALGRAAVVTGCAARVVDDLERRFGLAPGRGVVVANGVDLDEQAGDVPPGTPARYVLALGRLVENKGFDLLVRAFAAARLPDDVHLVVGGDGPEDARLRRLAAELGVAGRTHLPGRLARGQVVALASGAEVLAVPSRAEAFGIVVLEGWRAGVPVVATTRGGPADLVRDGEDGWLADPEDTEAFAAALRAAVLDRDAAARIGRAGRARVQEFTWERIAGEYLDLYRSIGVAGPRVAGSRP